MRIPSLGPLESAMTERIQEFLRNRRKEGLDTEPCLVVDLEVVRDNYQSFAKALPDSRVFTEKACPSLPGVRAGSSPNQSTAAKDSVSVSRHCRVSIVRQRQCTHDREFLLPALSLGPLGRVQ